MFLTKHQNEKNKKSHSIPKPWIQEAFMYVWYFHINLKVLLSIQDFVIIHVYGAK